jgi:DNA invertase Pin-like site-specific DNA recombinase
MKYPISEKTAKNAMAITMAKESEWKRMIDRLGISPKKHFFCQQEIGADCQHRIEDLKVDSVVVKNTSELWTIVADEDQLLGFLKFISVKKIRFVSIEDQIDLNASQSELILLLLEQYRRQVFHQRSKNVRMGIQQAKKSGKALGRPTKCDSEKNTRVKTSGIYYSKNCEGLKYFCWISSSRITW